MKGFKCQARDIFFSCQQEGIQDFRAESDLHKIDFGGQMDLRFKRGSRERSTGRMWGGQSHGDGGDERH